MRNGCFKNILIRAHALGRKISSLPRAHIIGATRGVAGAEPDHCKGCESRLKLRRREVKRFRTHYLGRARIPAPGIKPRRKIIRRLRQAFRGRFA